MDYEVMEEILTKYGEWIEQSEKPGLLLVQIMSQMIRKERDKQENNKFRGYYGRIN